MSASSVALPPHPTLSAYYHSANTKRSYLRKMFDASAADYDHIERLLSFGSGRWYRRQALRRAGLAPNMKVLDVAVGTGLVAREEITITGHPSHVVGLDPSPGMMKRAVHSLGISAIQGIGEYLPLASNHFDFLSMGYALRHLGDLRQAFSEFHRVLRPNGRLCILEITAPTSPLYRSLLKGYMRRIVPMLTRILTRRQVSQTLWQYYWDTIEACLPPKTIIQTLQQSGFNNVQRHVQLGLFSEYTATKNP